MVSCNDTFAVGAVAYAPPATAKDTPVAPNTGKAILRRFRFEARFACAMLSPFISKELTRHDRQGCVQSQSTLLLI